MQASGDAYVKRNNADFERQLCSCHVSSLDCIYLRTI